MILAASTRLIASALYLHQKTSINCFRHCVLASVENAPKSVPWNGLSLIASLLPNLRDVVCTYFTAHVYLKNKNLLFNFVFYNTDLFKKGSRFQLDFLCTFSDNVHGLAHEWTVTITIFSKTMQVVHPIYCHKITIEISCKKFRMLYISVGFFQISCSLSYIMFVFTKLSMAGFVLWSLMVH